jgi:hypothetical protein
MAAFFSFEVTSRSGALNSIGACGIDDLLSELQSAFTPKVKRGLGAAFSATGEVTINYLQVYKYTKEKFVSQLLEKGIHAENFAFINTKGKQLTKLGDFVTKFFKPYGFRPTTTDLRSLMDTEVT